MSPIRDLLFITVSVRLHMSIFSQEGLSALMYAAEKGHTEVVTQLLEAGANIDLQTTKVQSHCTVCV